MTAALENLRLTPSAEPAPESTPQPEEEPTDSSSSTRGFQCVSYGIGNFSSCVRSRYQLAFLLLLLEELKVRGAAEASGDPGGRNAHFPLMLPSFSDPRKAVLRF